MRCIYGRVPVSLLTIFVMLGKVSHMLQVSVYCIEIGVMTSVSESVCVEEQTQCMQLSQHIVHAQLMRVQYTLLCVEEI